MNIEKVKKCIVFENEEGNVLAKFQDVKSFEGVDELEKVRINDSWVIINRDFEVISRKYKGIGEFMKSSDLTVAIHTDGTYSFINKQGEEICRPFDNLWAFSKGRALVQDGGKFFFINKDGERVGPRFDFISRYGQLGRNIQSPAMGSAKEYFEFATEFQPYKGWVNGLAIIFIDGKQGIISRKTQLVTEVCYDEISLNGVPKTSPYIPVSKKGKWGYIDRRTGDEVTRIIYDTQTKHTQLTSLTRLAKDKKFGIVDTQGFELSEFKYDRIGSFSEGVAVVRMGMEYNYLNEENFSLISNTNFKSACTFIGGFGEVIIKTIFGYRTRYMDKQGRLFKKLPH